MINIQLHLCRQMANILLTHKNELCYQGQSSCKLVLVMFIFSVYYLVNLNGVIVCSNYTMVLELQFLFNHGKMSRLWGWVTMGLFVSFFYCTKNVAWLFGWSLVVHGPLGYNTYPDTFIRANCYYKLGLIQFTQ
jgi:hypothetical protein